MLSTTRFARIAVGALAVPLLLVLAVGATLVEPVLGARGYDVAYLVVILGTAGVAAARVRGRSDAGRWVAQLIAAGLVLCAVGDVVWTLDSWQGAVDSISLSDVCYLAGVCCMIAGLSRVTTRGRTTLVDVGAVVDVLTIGTVAAMVLWQTAASHIARIDGGSAGRAVQTTYPVLDAVLVGLVVRMAWSTRRREWLGPWFTVGLSCWLATDVANLYAYVPGGDQWMALGWMVGAILMAQSLSRQSAPLAAEPTLAVSTMSRLLVAILPLGVPTALLLAEPGYGQQHRPMVLVGTIVLLTLALVRMMRLLHSEATARAQLEVARDEALAASRAKTAFLATVSHELRTPMNGVLGLTDLLLDTELDERQRRYAGGVSRAGGSLLGIINDILDFSRLEAGPVSVETLDLDVVQVLGDVTDLALDPARPPGREIRVSIDPHLPTALRGDPARLGRVLLNLVVNAVKFSPDGVVRVRADLVGRRGRDVEVRFEVSDEGIGIAAADLGRIFESFAQADSSSTRAYGGTGLGLTISQRLVSAMGGTLEAASTPGVGSTFWFTLPLGVRRARARVLVVQEGEINQIVTERILHHLGYDTCLTEDPHEGLARLRDGDVDAVVLDCHLAEAGLYVVSGVPTVGLVDDASPDALARAEALGVVAVVARPLAPGAIGAALAQALAPVAAAPVG